MQYIKCKSDGNNEFMHHVRQVNTAETLSGRPEESLMIFKKKREIRK